MAAVEAQALARLLAPELRYVHSTGVCDTRESLLHKVRERAITCLALSFDDMHVTVTEDIAGTGNNTRRGETSKSSGADSGELGPPSEQLSDSNQPREKNANGTHRG